MVNTLGEALEQCGTCICLIYIYKTGDCFTTAWFKHILFITRHDKRIGQSKKLCLALSNSVNGKLGGNFDGKFS